MEEERMESVEEWEQRIRQDYHSIRQKLNTLVGVHPTAHAWPEGNYGQQAYVNVRTATARNLEWVREGFRLGFHQNGFGVNARSRDRVLLERLEPQPDWTGATIVEHLGNRSPTVSFLRELLQQALWDREPEMAASRLEALAALGVPERTLLWDESRVAILLEQYETAEQKLQQYLSLDETQDEARRADAWNLIANVHYAAGDHAAAVQAYETSLTIDPYQPQTLLDLAVVHEADRRYERALEICRQVHREHPEFVRVFPALGRLQDLLDQPCEAFPWWSRASEAFPDTPDYAFRAERARYACGDHAVAIARLNELLALHPDHEETRVFLIQCAKVRDDLGEALRLLTEWQQLDTSDPVDLSLQVARLHAQQADYSAAIFELRRLLETDPVNGEAKLLLAECLRLAGRPADSIQMLEPILDGHPTSRRAQLALADAMLDSGDPEQASSAIHKLRLEAPHDAYLLLREADYQYAGGHLKESAALLEGWLATNRGPALPVLRYRGLTTSAQDPRLAQRDNQTVETFADHMQELHQAGYQTVTCSEVAAWMQAQGGLPTNAILITFEGGRLDSLRLADPILAEHGYRAVMFVNASNPVLNRPGYATWEDLVVYRDTGRWDLQSQGTLSATLISIDATGRTAGFLVSRQWDDALNRPETEAEWAERVAEEHASTLRTMDRHLGVVPIAFAWPNGDYGQEGLPNLAGAAVHNPRLAKEAYVLAFSEDRQGLNLSSTDPMQLNRLSPHQDWSGADLVAHFQSQDPTQSVLYQLLRQAAWQGRIHEGYRWLDELRAAGAPPSRVAMAEALLRTMAGDSGHALVFLGDEGRAAQPSQEALSLRRSIDRQRQARARLWLDGWADNDDRYTLSAHLGGGLHVLDNTRLEVTGIVAEYHQDDVATLSEAAAKIRLNQQLSAFHGIEAQVGGHVFESPAKDLVSYALRWDASWSDQLRTGLGAEFQPGYTAEMLLANVNYHRAQLDTTWMPREDLNIRVVGRYWAYTDDNSRVDLVAQGAYELPWVNNLKALYRLTLADTDLELPEYYTPQQLVQNQLGLDYVGRPTDHISWRVRYLPGYGIEQGKGGRFVHAVHADILFRDVLTLDIRPSMDFQQTPTYQMFRATLTLERSF
jgi:tetratricopeptide (TPR) repeat protein/peptidoglycan/xylan/chitin deacetylase (PgdA/CDA1 family)